MGIVAKAGLALGIFVFLTVAVCLGGFMSTNNTCVRHEKTIQAQYEQNKNNYDNYFKKIKEICQVPEMYTSDLKKVYDSTMQGRYGKGGSNAMFQFLKEHNPNFDSGLYKQIQVAIESGRNDFESNQKTLLDKKRVYETYLGEFPTNMFAGALGFPKVNLDEFGIVISDETDGAFKSKRSAPLQLNPH